MSEGSYTEDDDGMELIGIEEHYPTAEVRGAWDAIGLAATDPSVALHSGEIERHLRDMADERLRLMDETGLDVSSHRNVWRSALKTSPLGRIVSRVGRHVPLTCSALMDRRGRSCCATAATC